MDDPDNGLRPHPLPVVMAMVMTCLALVRPVGMSDVAAEEWAALAANEIRDVPADLLDEACALVRRTVTFHGKIVPTVFAHVQQRWDDRKRMRFALVDRDHRPGAYPERAGWWQPTADELAAVRRELAANLRVKGDGQ